ncbi:MBL fold metallo-hydrolase [Jeotgalibacillus aurantiacus]|uniref:MBL fold metallo-hydrolase n=1 Tax=Jeotgalibacillus aurantiacus TaxID=2763266 RepID=UPI001D0B641F|nr:MBL fold metallo-hydrolase [Jeotgalibacillus aurantiacus]
MLKNIHSSIYYMPNDDDRERPTLGLVVGDQCSLIIDAGNSVQHAQDFLKEIESLNVPPVKYVVVTHGHWDHFLGLSEFNATIIANRLTSQIIHEWQQFTFDDDSLQEYVDDNKMSAKCMEIIKTEMPERESFSVVSPDLTFETSLTIDLGNKLCVIEKVRSTHTDDSTIVYVPDDKVLFLGDCAYGTTTNSLFHYKQSQLLPMINDIQKYDAEFFLLGHESLCDQAEMKQYWDELTAASKATSSASLEEAVQSFEKENSRPPNANETFFIEAFVNDWVIRSR